MLYKWIHKKHHQWTAPIGLVSIYATPVEYVFGNTLSVSSVCVCHIWGILILILNCVGLGEYKLSLYPS